MIRNEHIESLDEANRRKCIGSSKTSVKQPFERRSLTHSVLRERHQNIAVLSGHFISQEAAPHPLQYPPGNAATVRRLGRSGRARRLVPWVWECRFAKRDV